MAARTWARGAVSNRLRPLPAVGIFLLLGAGFLIGEEGSLLKTLPREAPGGWKMDGTPDEYGGDDLFLYINGGAEIYHEYGFSRVIVQEYAGPDDHSISLEIYRMADSEAAFGMYSFKTSADGEALSLGGSGRLEDYYLNFWKGRHLVTLTGFDEDPATREGLKVLAAGVADRLPAGGGLPELIDRLPEAGMDRAGIKYFKGPLGLFNTHRFFDRTVVEFDRGVGAAYSDGSRLFIFEVAAGDSVASFSAWERGFRDDAGYRDIQAVDDRTLTARSEEGGLIVARRGEGYVAVVLDAPSLDAAGARLAALAENYGR